MTYLESDAIRSLLIGFLLYAIADEPIWFFSNGSSISLRCCKSLISFENLCALAATPARTFNTRVSSLREYVCPETGKHFSNPIFFAIISSNFLTFSSSPSKSSMKLACVPVVPFEPKSFIVERTYSTSSRSITNS